MRDKFPEPKEFRNFEYKGEIELFCKTNTKNGKINSRKIYALSIKKSILKNHLLGTFQLEKDRVYDCRFATVGMNPTLKRNNIWIAQRNLKNVTGKEPEQYLCMSRGQYKT